MRPARPRRAVPALLTLAGAGAASLALVAIGASATTTRSITNGSASELSYAPAKLSAPAGTVTIRFTNKGVASHNVALRGGSLKKPVVGKTVGKGKVSTVRASLKKGSYTYYCTVPGHEAAGMKGKLTVK